MKLRRICHFCLIDEGIHSEAAIELDKWPFIEMQCKKGYRQRFMLSTELYELLFEQATRCLHDGYYREAIGTYNAALERFFEYAIEIMLGVKSEIDFTEFWKCILFSERQLGAYYALWVSTFNELPIKLDEKKVKLRNDVVHNGKLASRAEAESFGEYVYNYIVPCAKKTRGISPILPFANANRIIRKSEKDIKKESTDPIYVDYHGEQSILATSTLKVSCLLNNEKICTFEDCLGQNLDNQYLELR